MTAGADTTAGADPGLQAGHEPALPGLEPGRSGDAGLRAPADALLARLTLLRERVAELVAQRSAADPTAADPLRGLYLSDEAVQHLLGPRGAAGPASGDVPHTGEDAASSGAGAVSRPGPGAPGGSDRLRRLVTRLGLGPLDEAILLLALAPDLDRTFEPLYGYLNDDVSRRRATVGLAVELCGLPVHDAVARARFHSSAPLRAMGLLQVEEAERPFLSRSLRVPDRVTAHLLGDDTPDAALAGQVTLLRPRPAESAPQGGPLVERLAERLGAGRPAVYLREEREGDALSCATAALTIAGLEALHFTPGHGSSGDAAADPAAPHPDQGEQGTTELVPDLLREARLRGCPIVVAPVPEKPGPLLRALLAQVAEGAPAGVSVLLAGGRPYDPHWCDQDPLVLDAPVSGPAISVSGRRPSGRRRARTGRRSSASIWRRSSRRTGWAGTGSGVPRAPRWISRRSTAGRCPRRICGSPPGSSPLRAWNSTPAGSGPMWAGTIWCCPSVRWRSCMSWRCGRATATGCSVTGG